MFYFNFFNLHFMKCFFLKKKRQNKTVLKWETKTSDSTSVLMFWFRFNCNVSLQKKNCECCKSSAGNIKMKNQVLFKERASSQMKMKRTMTVQLSSDGSQRYWSRKLWGTQIMNIKTFIKFPNPWVNKGFLYSQSRVPWIFLDCQLIPWAFITGGLNSHCL